MKYIKRSLERKASEDSRLRDTVAAMIEKVRAEGDSALIEYGRSFDASERESFAVSRQEIVAAYEKITEQELSDLKSAKNNIEAFAKAQKDSLRELPDFSPLPGIHLSHKVMPVASACAYVPGGSYPLFSTALMLIIPAKMAGVERVCACSPVIHGTNEINHLTLVAMDLAGADEIYAVGGAQAIAAFAYGTESIRPVDMIVGPGNRYVAEAKRQCYGQVGIDFVAGPSEVLVIADGDARADVVAADILAQCEHDPNAKGIVVSTDEEFALAVIKEVEAQLEILDTADIAAKSWKDYGEVIVVDSLDEAVRIANDISPEHLEVNVAEPCGITDLLVNYGSLFVGGETAEVFGDYASGTNHTLPTVRAARYTGGVWAGTFLKVVTGQWMTKEASRELAPVVERLAKGEGLSAHARAAAKRKE